MHENADFSGSSLPDWVSALSAQWLDSGYMYGVSSQGVGISRIFCVNVDSDCGFSGRFFRKCSRILRCLKVVVMPAVMLDMRLVRTVPKLVVIPQVQFLAVVLLPVLV